MPIPSTVRAVTPARQRGYRQKQDDRNENLGWTRMSLVVPDDQTASFRHAAAVARAVGMHEAVKLTETPANDPMLIEIAASSFARAVTDYDMAEIERAIDGLPEKEQASVSKVIRVQTDAMMAAQNKRDDAYAKAEDARERKRVGEEMVHAAEAVAWSYSAAAILQEIWLLLPVVDVDDELTEGT